MQNAKQPVKGAQQTGDEEHGRHARARAKPNQTAQEIGLAEEWLKQMIRGQAAQQVADG